MSRDDQNESASQNGAERPVWLQVGIGLVMAAAVMAAVYLLFSRLL